MRLRNIDVISYCHSYSTGIHLCAINKRGRGTNGAITAERNRLMSHGKISVYHFEILGQFINWKDNLKR